MVDLYNTGVRAIIDDYLVEESKKKRNYGEYWSASSAGYCMRRNIFERMGVPHIETEDEARKQRVFTAGHVFHNWIQGLTKASGVSIAQEGELKDEKLKILGHFDDLIEVRFDENGDTPVRLGAEQRAKKLILYDYKTANSRSFNYKKELSHYHKMQLGTYMYLLRHTELADGVKNLNEGRILILEKDTLRTREFVLKWTPQLEKEIVSYWSTLNGYWKKQTLPKCTCADYEGGFLAKEAYNPFFYNGEPCSVEYYKKWKADNE